MINIDRNRKDSAGIPLNLTIVDKKRVKNVKLKINPTITPIGCDLPDLCPPTEVDNIIGKTGKMHGERTVTIPAKNANAISRIISILYLTRSLQFDHHSILLLRSPDYLLVQMYVDK